jgi:hypothetical protein
MLAATDILPPAAIIDEGTGNPGFDYGSQTGFRPNNSVYILSRLCVTEPICLVLLPDRPQPAAGPHCQNPTARCLCFLTQDGPVLCQRYPGWCFQPFFLLRYSYIYFF